jgi:hypothetical protein
VCDGAGSDMVRDVALGGAAAMLCFVRVMRCFGNFASRCDVVGSMGVAESCMLVVEQQLTLCSCCHSLP